MELVRGVQDLSKNHVGVRESTAVQVRFVVHVQNIFTLPVARQVRELQAALSVNKSELARILRVTRPTVYDWLDGG